jgi:protease I
MNKSFLLIILLVSIFQISGCTISDNLKKMTSSKPTNKILMVVAPIDFRDAEYFEPRKIIEESGLSVNVTSIQGSTARSVDGKEIGLDANMNDIKTDDYAAVIFIGGPGMGEITGDESLQHLARKFYDAGKLTGAICVAPSILSKAGILEGKKATSWEGSKKDLEDGKADFTGEGVTVDGMIITANGPEAAKEFGEAVVKALGESK